jgi:hypothetical protein
MSSMQSMLRLYSEDQWSPQVGVSGYYSGVLSCTVRCRYQVMNSEDTADLVFAVVSCRACMLGKVLLIICSYKCSINQIQTPHLVTDM